MYVSAISYNVSKYISYVNFLTYGQRFLSIYSRRSKQSINLSELISKYRN